MFFKKFKDYIVIRIEKGEELVSTLKKFCKEEKIFSGTILSCIGAANKISDLTATQKAKTIEKTKNFYINFNLLF